MPNAANVKTAYAMINGQKVVAVYDETTGLYTVETTAPSESSWSQPDHVYQVTLHAEDLAGNTVSMDSTDETYGDQLKIRVLEKTAPVAEITSPTQDAVLGTNTQNVTMTLEDSGGSGINLTTVVFKVNSVAVTEGITWTGDEDTATSVGEGESVVKTYHKYTGTYTAADLSDGVNRLSLTVTDNDGNTSTEATVSFVISTVAPLLTITAPSDNLITNGDTVTVSGKTKPGSDLTVISTVTVNGQLVELSTELDEEGYKTFTYDVTLTAGENTITIVSRDSAGKTTTVTRTVTLDTEAPVITDVHAVATTVDASGMIKITFKVVDRPASTPEQGG